MSACFLSSSTLNLASSSTNLVPLTRTAYNFLHTSQSSRFSLQSPRLSRRQEKPTKSAMAAPQSVEAASETSASAPPMKLLFVEMGVGYDQHGQDINSAAMRACRDAITSNSIPAFRRAHMPNIIKIQESDTALLFEIVADALYLYVGSIPGVTFDQMKLQIKLGVPHSLQQFLDVEKIKSVFPYGKILNVEVVDGGLICSSGVLVEEMGDKNDDCYIVNAAVYIGY